MKARQTITTAITTCALALTIAHNKVIIVDGRTVEQGSFNYTKAAENSNAENVLVNWNNPKLAELYLRDWQKHWEHSDAVAARY